MVVVVVVVVVVIVVVVVVIGIVATIIIILAATITNYLISPIHFISKSLPSIFRNKINIHTKKCI